jgi:hypothetical protein
MVTVDDSGAPAAHRSGAQPYSASSSAMPGAVDRSTDEASSSSTILRACLTRGERLHDHAGLDGAGATRHEHSRASTSTTHSRQTLTGRSVSR